MNTRFYVPLQRIEEEKQMVYGWCQTEEVATDGMIMTTEAMKNAIADYFEKGPALRDMHIGAAGYVVDARVDESKPGTYVAAKVVDPVCWLKVKEGVYRGFSIGGRVEDYEPKSLRITNFKWVETSLVDRPADPGARIDLWRAERQESVDFERAVSVSDLPIYDDLDYAWDADAAVKRVRRWATADDDEIDWSKYRKAFFWYDADNPELFGSYKLPFADVFAGELKAVWRGVSAAMAALLGARGGVNIPAREKKAVYNQIAKYYKKFGKDVPNFSRGESLEKGEITMDSKKKLDNKKSNAEELSKTEELSSAPNLSQPVVQVDEVVERLEKTIKETLEKALESSKQSEASEEAISTEQSALKRLEAIAEENKKLRSELVSLKEQVAKLGEVPVPPKVRASFAIQREAEKAKDKNREQALSIARKLEDLRRIAETDKRRYEQDGLTKVALRYFGELQRLGYSSNDVEELIREEGL